MAVAKVAPAAVRPLSLPEELIVMLLNEQIGYFHQVPGWNMNCAVVGAALAELSFLSRIDTDMESLHLIDRTETGDPALDPILKEIADEPVQRNAHYWIERLVLRAESIIDLTLDRLIKLKILEYHEGDFWTLAPTQRFANLHDKQQEGTAGQFIKARINEVIFTDAIPDPRDIVIICLVNTCDVLRFIYELDDETEERIRFICQMDLIGRSIADAVEHNISSPLHRHSSLSKQIPRVSQRHLLLSPHLRSGNLPALFAELTKQYGPVFELRPPFVKPMLFVAGPQINHWAQRHGRMYLRAKDYFAEFEKLYGASGVLPSLDGSDHFRLRKAMAPAFSRNRLESQLDQLYDHVRKFMSTWTVGVSTRCARRPSAAPASC